MGSLAEWEADVPISCPNPRSRPVRPRQVSHGVLRVHRRNLGNQVSAFFAALLATLSLAGCSGIASSNSSTANPTATAASIMTQPASQSVILGQAATFTVTAAGIAPLMYQWQKNAANISGAITSSYTTPATTAADNAAKFAVVVSNSAGSATSSSATLTVSAANAAPTITTQPANQTVN